MTALYVGQTGTSADSSCPHISKSNKSSAAAKPHTVYRRAEVQQHNSVDSGVWVTYRGGVYDVTPFLHSHPGGVDKLMLAAGEDLFPIWRQTAFRQHFASPVVAELLEELRVGTLHPDDVEASTDIEQLPAIYPASKIYDCIIVGSGVSGLRCGHALTAEHGVKKEDILVLEAQDYVGGRVRQVQIIGNCRCGG